MKKNRILRTICAVLVAILCASIFAACQQVDENIREIKKSEVEKITAGNHVLSENQTKELIKLYNASEYLGTDGDTTPDFIYEVHLKDGSVISITDCCRPMLKIYIDGADGKLENFYVIKNDKLHTYLKELKPE